MLPVSVPHLYLVLLLLVRKNPINYIYKDFLLTGSQLNLFNKKHRLETGRGGPRKRTLALTWHLHPLWSHLPASSLHPSWFHFPLGGPCFGLRELHLLLLFQPKINNYFLLLLISGLPHLAPFDFSVCPTLFNQFIILSYCLLMSCSDPG